MVRDLLLLTPLARLGDAGALLVRLGAGAVLIQRAQEQMLSAERMAAFETLLSQYGVFAPQLTAPLCVLAQLLCGVALVFGFLTRWAGVFTALIFVAALWVGPQPAEVFGWWPHAVLVLLGVLFATAGAGRYSLDTLLLRGAAR